MRALPPSPRGALTLGPNFQGPVTQLNVALPPSGAPPSEGPSIVVQGQNPIENLVQGLDQAVNFTVVYDPLDEETKKQQDKKLPSCKG